MKTLYAGGLSLRTSEDSLRTMFASYGIVERVQVVTERDRGRSRGFAFIEMLNDGEAGTAIAALNGKLFDGRVLKVNEARTREHGEFSSRRVDGKSIVAPKRNFGPLRVRHPQW